jgi:hypothetical protein
MRSRTVATEFIRHLADSGYTLALAIAKAAAAASPPISGTVTTFAGKTDE